jgi:hypothetical protein
MKKFVLLLAIAVGSSAALADEFVSGYLRSDGTYVAPHFRSSPNSYRFDNYSSQGNTNPYTGQQGYEPHEFSSPPVYTSPYNSRSPYNYGNSQ